MAPRAKNEATAASAWLIEEAEPAGDEPAEEPAPEDDFAAAAPPPAPSEKPRPEKSVAEDVSAETRQWLAVPPPARNGSSAEGRKAGGTRQAGAKAKPKPEPPHGEA